MAHATSFTGLQAAAPSLFRQALNLFRQRLAESRARTPMRVEPNGCSDRHLADADPVACCR